MPSSGRPVTGPETETVRVVVVDDEAEHRLLVRSLLSKRIGWTVIGEARDGLEAIEVVERLQPDVCVLDLRMPNPGDRALPHILKVAPNCMIAVLSILHSRDVRQRLLELGAFGCYPKSDFERFVDLLARDYGRFLRALTGEEAAPGWLLDDDQVG